jgi:hypothetical protein
MQVTDARLHVKAEFKSWMSDGCVRGEHLNTSSTVQSRIASKTNEYKQCCDWTIIEPLASPSPIDRSAQTGINCAIRYDAWAALDSCNPTPSRHPPLFLPPPNNSIAADLERALCTRADAGMASSRYNSHARTYTYLRAPSSIAGRRSQCELRARLRFARTPKGSYQCCACMRRSARPLGPTVDFRLKIHS